MSSIIKVDTIQDQDGNNIINENANTITIGASGDTITIPSGATLANNGTATGFASIAWQSVQTTGFTAVAGNGYFCNTTSAGFTVTLPATPSAGDQIQLVDYAGTFNTNNLTIDPNGEDIVGQTSNVFVVKDREAITLTYIDSTQGWLPTSGYQEGTQGLSVPYSVDFLVIAGGGGGGYRRAGGGGAGGYRNSYSTEASGGGGSSEASLTFLPGTVYTITVGAGGAGSVSENPNGTNGVDSSISGSGISTITSTGGGGGASADYPGEQAASSGGSGGGAGSAYDSASRSGGSGTANQGFAGGNATGPTNDGAGGGGGASAVGGDGAANAGNGGAGLASSITGSSVDRAGGGGGGSQTGGRGTGGTGGGGDGARQTPSEAGSNGTVNTGGGGGGGSGGGAGFSGGKGVVILRMPTANYSGTTTGSPTVGTDGTDTILTFNDSGSYTG